MSNENETPKGITEESVNTAMVALIAQKRVSQAQADALIRFVTEARKRKLSLAQMAEQLDTSTTTVSRALRGIYEGDLGLICDKAKLAVRLWQERAGFGQRIYVPTAIAKKVESVCEFALTRQVPVILTGLSQQGKTTALKRFAEQSDAAVRFVRIPAACSLSEFLDELCEACGVASHHFNNGLRKHRVMTTLNDRSLLIVDELHELVISCTKASALKICEVLREIYDRTGCGMVLCGTDTLRIDLLEGAHAAWLDQLVQRSVSVSLPRQLTAQDIRAVAKAYGLADELDERAREAIKGMRMNILCLLLSSARDLALRTGKPLTWALFVSTKNALLG